MELLTLRQQPAYFLKIIADNWGQIEASCPFGTHAYNALKMLDSLILDINEDRTFFTPCKLKHWCFKFSWFVTKIMLCTVACQHWQRFCRNCTNYLVLEASVKLQTNKEVFLWLTLLLQIQLICHQDKLSSLLKLTKASWKHR